MYYVVCTETGQIVLSTARQTVAAHYTDGRNTLNESHSYAMIEIDPAVVNASRILADLY